LFITCTLYGKFYRRISEAARTGPPGKNEQAEEISQEWAASGKQF
jgi:hypothetical protein